LFKSSFCLVEDVFLKPAAKTLFSFTAVESVKSQSDLARASVRAFSPGEALKLSPGLARAATGGHIAKIKFDPKSKTMVKELPNYNSSKIKALAAVQRNIRKIVPRKGVSQLQTEIKPRPSGIAAVDETDANQALDVSNFRPMFQRYCPRLVFALCSQKSSIYKSFRV